MPSVAGMATRGMLGWLQGAVILRVSFRKLSDVIGHLVVADDIYSYTVACLPVLIWAEVISDFVVGCHGVYGLSEFDEATLFYDLIG